MTYGCLFNNSLQLQLSGAGGAVRGTHPRLQGLLINQKDKIINQGWRLRVGWGPEPVAVREGTAHPRLGEVEICPTCVSTGASRRDAGTATCGELHWV